MNDTIKYNPSETINTNFESLELYATLEYLKNKRKTYAGKMRDEIKAEIDTHKEKWYDILSESSVTELTGIDCGFCLYNNTDVFSKLRLERSTPAVEVKHFNIKYNFYSHACDVGEDIDIQNFYLHLGKTSFDDLMKLHFVWDSMKDMLPMIIKWERETQNIYEDCSSRLFVANVQLKNMDDEITAVRERIKSIEWNEFLNGKTLQDESYWKFWFKSNKYEFVKSVRVVELSPTGKTATLEAMITPKQLHINYYYPINSKKFIKKTFTKVRVSSLGINFSLPNI
jgi:hypothetical protein